MKKLAAVCFGLISATAFANNAPAPATATKNTAQPMMKVAVYDISNKVSREIGSQYSVSNSKNLLLCWTAFNMSFEPANRNKVTQVFVAPSDKANFSSEGASKMVSADGKTFTLSSVLPAQNNEAIQQCWRFDHNDPLGKYSLSVRVNDIQFPATEFEVVK